MYNKDQQDALFTFSVTAVNNLYNMFRAGLLLIIKRHDSVYAQLVYFMLKLIKLFKII
jgi:hypothetical protein